MCRNNTSSVKSNVNVFRNSIRLVPKPPCVKDGNDSRASGYFQFVKFYNISVA